MAKAISRRGEPREGLSPRYGVSINLRICDNQDKNPGECRALPITHKYCLAS